MHNIAVFLSHRKHFRGSFQGDSFLKFKSYTSLFEEEKNISKNNLEEKLVYESRLFFLYFIQITSFKIATVLYCF